MPAQNPQGQYQKKLTNPSTAVESIRNGSILCIALGVGMRSGLAKAFADRVLMGEADMFAFMNDNPALEGYSSAYVTDIRIIAQHDRMMSVNTAIEIDLYGQVNAEFINGLQYSGTGGQYDFVKRAACSKDGKSFIALKSAAKKATISCIVPRVQMATDTCMDVEHVVTEYGCVHLRGKSTKERAELLISIAHPNFREQLADHANSISLIWMPFERTRIP